MGYSVVELQIISDRVLSSHSVPGTREIKYSFTVFQNGQELIAGTSTAKLNQHGVHLSEQDFHNQVTHAGLRQQLMIQVKKLLIDLMGGAKSQQPE